MPEPLAHPQRVLAHPFARRRFLQPDQVEQLVDAGLLDPHRLRRERQRLAPAPAGVLGGGVEQDADPAPGVGQLAVGPAEHRGAARVGAGEPADHPHRGRLPRPVGAEEAGHGARLAAEGDVADDGPPTESLGQLLGFDHARSIPLPRGARIGRRSASSPRLRSTAGPYFGSGSGPLRRPYAVDVAAVELKQGLEPARWQRRLLPGSMVDGPDAERSLRDWVVDALVTVVALGLGVLAMHDTWHQHGDRARGPSTSSSASRRRSRSGTGDAIRSASPPSSSPPAAISALAGGAGAGRPLQRGDPLRSPRARLDHARLRRLRRSSTR